MEHTNNGAPGRLTPEVLQRSRVTLGRQTLEGLSTYDDVMGLSCALMRECADHLFLLSGTALSIDDGHILTYTRDGAVLAGNFVRLGKLVRSFLRLMEAGEGYGARALERLIGEAAISLLYLLTCSREELARYRLGGLGNLKKALEMVSDCPVAHHGALPHLHRSIS